VDEQARCWIERLKLAAHPEGGYYLLPSEEVSTLHRLRSDELFHFYAG
jgi:predicted cupin superfamily sugar epimerase